jgi:hypothetical protein
MLLLCFAYPSLILRVSFRHPSGILPVSFGYLSGILPVSFRYPSGILPLSSFARPSLMHRSSFAHFSLKIALFEVLKTWTMVLRGHKRGNGIEDSKMGNQGAGIERFFLAIFLSRHQINSNEFLVGYSFQKGTDQFFALTLKRDCSNRYTRKVF